jgi:hypothetical protein
MTTMTRAVKRTKWRLINYEWELRNVYHMNLDNLPDCMEILPDGFHVAIYLTEEEAKARGGEIFPRCPVTGAFCVWDTDWMKIGDLY